MGNTDKQCGFCGKPYEREAEVVYCFGRFCLHDDKLDEYRGLAVSSVKNDSVAISGSAGFTPREQAFKDRENRKGNAVVKGTDGVVRSLGAN